MGIFKGKEKQVMIIPPEIEHRVAKSEDRPTVRRSIRRAIFDLFTCFPDQDTFDKKDLEEMKRGRAPYAHPDQRIGDFDKMQIHHKTPKHKIANKKTANRLSNLIALSPLLHDSDFIDDEYHRGEYYGKKKKEERRQKEEKRRSQIK